MLYASPDLFPARSFARLFSRPFVRAASLALLAGLTLGGAATPSQAQMYSKLVVFGDSLSDTGNLYRLDGGIYPQSPPYYNGRFCNGPIWIDDLAANSAVIASPALVEDVALGGAHTDATNDSSLLYGMQTEVNGYLALHSKLDPNALYIVFGGGNDYLGGQTDPTVPVGNLTAEITQLANSGARNFLVPNLSDLGALPATNQTPFSAALSQLTAAHNAALAQSLQNLRLTFSGDNFLLLDDNALFKQVAAAPSVYGLMNVTDSYLATHPAGGSDADSYLFWDTVHPTEVGQRLLAQSAFALAVPEPGSVALLAGLTFGGAGFLARRRRLRKHA